MLPIHSRLPMPSVHVIVSTHTPRHLRRTLLGLACQTLRPGRIVVTSDTDDAAIERTVADAAREFELPILLTMRPFLGVSRSSQVRNNGVQALLAQHADPHDLLVILDGDCCPAPDALAAHARLASTRPDALVIGFRIDLTPSQTDAFDESRLRLGQPPVDPTVDQIAGLRKRHRRYTRHEWMRRLGLGKPHKPKLLSANFSLPLGLYQRVNGFDEAYEGYGQEDDDFGRRLYVAGARPVIGIVDAMVFHQFHLTRAPQDWDRSPNAARFAQPFAIRCRLGLDNPSSQPEPRRRCFELTSDLPAVTTPGKQAAQPTQEPTNAP